MTDKTSEKDRIDKMLDVVMKVARGDYSVQVELSGKNDEFDSLAMGLNMMIDDIRTSIEDLGRQKKELSALNKRLQQEITERKRAEDDLAERVKELTCLYGASQLVAKADATLDEILQGMVDLIPGSWQYPEVTCARLTFGGKEFKSDNFKTTQWKQSADINIKECKEGTIEVYYLEEKPEAAEGPFLEEERNLIDGIARILSEMTERKRAEEAVQESEEKLKRIFESVIDGITVTDLNGVITEVNDQIVKSHGLVSKDQLIGKNGLEFIAERDRQRAAEHLSTVLETGSIKGIEYGLLQADGSEFVAETSASVLNDPSGNPVGFIAITRDITERKRAEETLRQSEEHLRTIFETTREGVIITGPDGRISFANPAAAAILGCKTAVGLVGRHATEIYLGPKQRKVIFEESTGKDYIENIEVTLKKEDGTPVYVLTNTTIHRDKEGNILRTEAFFTDITEHKQMEAKSREAEQKAQVSNRLATVGQMASGIAHEINNPLTGVIGFANLLQRKDIPEDIKKDVEIIHDGAQRVASIVQRLLIFARQEKLRRESLNINEPIAATVAMRAYEMETSNINVTMQLAPDLPRIIADSGQLQQVFLNIILNAETEMKLAHGKGNLLVKTETIDNAIRISFEDDGPGIPKENLEKIFDPFFTTREVGEGTGLGLSICYGIVTEHGGTIYAQSEPGKGATFIVELPIVTEAKELAEPAADEAESEAKAKILVVDDEPIVCELLSEILTEAGHDVDTVDNATNALEKLESKRYSLILLDIKMRGMSGIELYQHIQKIARSLAKRVVFITGDIMGADTWKFLHKTKAPYLIKPFDEEQLGKEINRILNQGA